MDTLAFDRAVYAALKPGGTYFILDHQGVPGMTDADIEKVHRIDRNVVIREVTSAGFKLAAEGKFLRRPADDHTKSIFDKLDPGPHRPVRAEIRQTAALAAARRELQIAAPLSCRPLPRSPPEQFSILLMQLSVHIALTVGSQPSK